MLQRGIVEAVEAFMSSGLLSCVGGTNRLHLGWFPAVTVLTRGKLAGGQGAKSVAAQPVLNCSAKVR